jgi:hypothetical protein
MLRCVALRSVVLFRWRWLSGGDDSGGVCVKDGEKHRQPGDFESLVFSMSLAEVTVEYKYHEQLPFCQQRTGRSDIFKNFTFRTQPPCFTSKKTN